MKIRRSCRDVTPLLRNGQEQALSLPDRVSVRLHLLAGKTCPRFERQLGGLRAGLRRWRACAESDEAGR